jgi:hypothetical protein
MLKRITSLSLLFLACLTTWAWADGGFYGTVTYRDCTCDLTDAVCIKLTTAQYCNSFDLERWGRKSWIYHS